MTVPKISKIAATSPSVPCRECGRGLEAATTPVKFSTRQPIDREVKRLARRSRGDFRLFKHSTSSPRPSFSQWLYLDQFGKQGSKMQFFFGFWKSTQLEQSIDRVALNRV